MVGLQSVIKRSFSWTDVPGRYENRVHCADTLNSHVRDFNGPNARVVHARLAAIVMNVNCAV